MRPLVAGWVGRETIVGGSTDDGGGRRGLPPSAGMGGVVAFRRVVKEGGEDCTNSLIDLPSSSQILTRYWDSS
jgi:hypothetical protein